MGILQFFDDQLFDKFQYVNFGGQSRFQMYVIVWKRLKGTALTIQVSQHKTSISYGIKLSLLVRKLLLTTTSSGTHSEVLTSLTLPRYIEHNTGTKAAVPTYICNIDTLYFTVTKFIEKRKSSVQPAILKIRGRKGQ